MKAMLIIVLVLFVSIAYIIVMCYFTQKFIQSIRLVGCHEVIRIGKRDNEIVYELHYLNGRKRRMIPANGSRIQRELERVAM